MKKDLIFKTWSGNVYLRPRKVRQHPLGLITSKNLNQGVFTRDSEHCISFQFIHKSWILFFRHFLAKQSIDIWFGFVFKLLTRESKMQDMWPVVPICRAKRIPLSKWFRTLEVVMSHRDLHHDARYLWVWLATTSANKPHHSCSLSYEQLSTALGISVRQVHRALLRLRITGFLRGDVPIWYNELTTEMIITKRNLVVVSLTKINCGTV